MECILSTCFAFFPVLFLHFFFCRFHHLFFSSPFSCFFTFWDSALSSALSCLNLTHPPSYYDHPIPERYSHFLALHSHIDSTIPSTFAPFCWKGYCGPWLETIWNSTRLDSFAQFSPFVPVFVPWVLLFLHPNANGNYATWVSRIFSAFQPQYLYVTLSQNDDGIEGREWWGTPDLPPNLLVMSQGGKGHIPLVLWLHRLWPGDFAIRDSYDYDLVFMGWPGTHWIRSRLRDAMLTRLGDRSHAGMSPLWKRTYRRAKFVLAPRGWGRNSYRLTEVLQAGMVPLYVYDDFKWLPYYDTIGWSKFAIVVKWDEFNEILPSLGNVSAERIKEMRLRVRELYETHFTPEAVFRHVFKFLREGFVGSDLRCGIYSRNRSLSTPPT